MLKITHDPSLCVRCGRCTIVCPNRIHQRTTVHDYPTCIEGGEAMCIRCYHCIAACPGGSLTVDGIGRDDCLESGQNIAVRFENFAHLVRNRRSIRHYTGEPLEDRVIEQLLDVVRWAPSAKNSLPLQWVIINKATKVRELSGLVMDCIKKMPNTERMVDVWNQGDDPVFRGAPCVIGAYTDDLTAQWSAIDTAIAVGTLDLCATAMRLGTCWAGIFVRAAQSANKSAINQWLGLKDTETIQGGLMLGHTSNELYQRIPHRPEAPKIWIR